MVPSCTITRARSCLMMRHQHWTRKIHRNGGLRRCFSTSKKLCHVDAVYHPGWLVRRRCWPQNYEHLGSGFNRDIHRRQLGQMMRAQQGADWALRKPPLAGSVPPLDTLDMGLLPAHRTTPCSHIRSTCDVTHADRYPPVKYCQAGVMRRPYYGHFQIGAKASQNDLQMGAIVGLFRDPRRRLLRLALRNRCVCEMLDNNLPVESWHADRHFAA